MVLNINNRISELATSHSNGDTIKFDQYSKALSDQLADLEAKVRLEQLKAGIPDLSQQLSEAVDSISAFSSKMASLELEISKALAYSKQVEYQILCNHKANLIANYQANLDFIKNNIDTQINAKMELYKALSKCIGSDKNNKFMDDNI
jgi:hypothetical protein